VRDAGTETVSMFTRGATREMRSTIASLTAAGKTVLLTTHYMFEADALCDRIAVISKGDIVAEGTPLELKRGVAEVSVLEIEVFGIAEGATERVRGLDGVVAVAVEERGQAQVLVVQTRPEVELTHAVLGHLNGADVGRISRREPTLEDAYVAGRLVKAVRKGRRKIALNDAATVALDLTARYAGWAAALEASEAARELRDVTLGEDVAFSAKADRFTVVPSFVDRRIVA